MNKKSAVSLKINVLNLNFQELNLLVPGKEHRR